MAAFVLNESGAVAGSKELYMGPSDVLTTFDITKFNFFTGSLAGAGIISVIALIFRQGVFAVAAILIWLVVTLVPVAQWFLLGAPMMLAAMLPSEVSYLSYVVTAFFAIVFFMFLMGIAAQREVT